MREVFDQLVKEGSSAVARLVEERRQENIELEFKMANSGNGIPSKEDRINLGIVLSAFSNSMGGLLVWGIEAKKNVEGIDCATNLRPISEIEKFKSEMTRLISQAMMPRNENIWVELVRSGSEANSGYLLVLVERSERRPHRCEFGEKQYFKRYGDSSIAMEHYDIEDSFKRLVVPWLELETNVFDAGGSSGPDGLKRRIGIQVFLKNPSTVTATHPYLIVDRKDGWGMRQRFLQHRVEKGRHYFFGGSDDAVHPSLSNLAVEFELAVKADRLAGDEFLVRRSFLTGLSFAYSCGCLNSRQSSGVISFAPEELIKGVPGGKLGD